MFVTLAHTRYSLECSHNVPSVGKHGALECCTLRLRPGVKLGLVSYTQKTLLVFAPIVVILTAPYTCILSTLLQGNQGNEPTTSLQLETEGVASFGDQTLSTIVINVMVGLSATQSRN